VFNPRSVPPVVRPAATDPPWTYPENIALGTVGAEIEGGSIFDGWGHVHLFDAETLEDLWIRSRFPKHTIRSLRSAFGDLTVHEVAVDPQHESLAYLSYYSGDLSPSRSSAQSRRFEHV
jgi:hypothetical protein